MKGDVHDIGKNIVGVVLACNNYEVIDLGVMVPADDPADTALEEQCDIVGVSGLITPSLDEMVNVANEMERRGMDLPLLIGGRDDVTPAHGGADRPEVLAADRARARRHARGRRRVVAARPRRARPSCDVTNRALQETLRAQHAEREKTPLLPYRKAIEHRTPIDWRRRGRPHPVVHGHPVVEPTIAELRTFIDWTFFFTAWELKGRYPKILDHPKHGAAARELFENATRSCWTRSSDGELAPGARRVRVLAGQRRGRRHRARERHGRSRCSASRPTRATTGRTDALADFIAPAEIGLADHIGAFAVTAGLGADELVKRFEAEHDDYRAIMVKALADRLAEAFAEYLHQEARIAWGYQDAPQPNEELVDERYRGIRPAFGYPACPDHSLKRRLFDLLARARDRDRPHRALRDDPGRSRVRPVLRPSRVAVLQRRPDRARTSSRTTPVAAARASTRPSAGCARTSRTTRTEPAPVSRRSGHRATRIAAGSLARMAHFWHPFADMAAVSAHGELVLVRGDGAHVWDESGRRYLDATAGLWFANVGFGRRDIADAAAAQMAALPAYSTFGDLSNRPASELAERVSSLAPVTDSRVFLTSGGSDSIDTATKMARRFWQLVGQPERTILIRRERAYHGMHTAGTSLAGIPANATGHGDLIEDVVQVRWDDADDLRSMIQQVGEDKVAAFFCEPVIGAGGVYPAPDGYLSAARAVCRETGVLFVADEVITGFGRCGAWFASGRWELEPDIITCAKGITSGYLPMGAVIAAPWIAEPFWARGRRRLAARLHVLRSRGRVGRRAREPGHHGARRAVRTGAGARDGAGAMRSRHWLALLGRVRSGRHGVLGSDPAGARRDRGRPHAARQDGDRVPRDRRAHARAWSPAHCRSPRRW